MGLDTSHNCWQGAYSAFMRWRRELAKVAGLPPLDLMEGFFSVDGGYSNNPFFEQRSKDKAEGHNEHIWDSLPIKWESLKPSALHSLLNHSDCEGEIAWQDCEPIADELEKLIPLMPQGEAGGHIGNWRDKTKQFVDGLRLAHKSKENVNFH